MGSIGIGIGIGISGVRLAGGGGFVGPYDNIPSIAAAYGMRRLLTSYTGNILRLRRNNDNAESDFGYMANGDLDTAAIATWLGANSGYVVTWYDQSGNGHNATQATAAEQPLYSNGALSFDGSDSLNTAIVPAAGWSMALRYSNLTDGQSFVYLAGSLAVGGTRFYIAGRTDANNQIVYALGGARSISPELLTGVVGVTKDGGYRNGVLDSTAPTAWSGTGAAITIGRVNNNGVLLASYAHTHHELIIANATYTAQQMSDIYTAMVS